MFMMFSKNNLSPSRLASITEGATEGIVNLFVKDKIITLPDQWHQKWPLNRIRMRSPRKHVLIHILRFWVLFKFEYSFTLNPRQDPDWAWTAHEREIRNWESPYYRRNCLEPNKPWIPDQVIVFPIDISGHDNRKAIGETTKWYAKLHFSYLIGVRFFAYDLYVYIPGSKKIGPRVSQCGACYII